MELSVTSFNYSILTYRSCELSKRRKTKEKILLLPKIAKIIIIRS